MFVTNAWPKRTFAVICLVSREKHKADWKMFGHQKNEGKNHYFFNGIQQTNNFFFLKFLKLSVFNYWLNFLFACMFFLSNLNLKNDLNLLKEFKLWMLYLFAQSPQEDKKFKKINLTLSSVFFAPVADLWFISNRKCPFKKTALLNQLPSLNFLLPQFDSKSSCPSDLANKWAILLFFQIGAHVTWNLSMKGSNLLLNKIIKFKQNEKRYSNNVLRPKIFILKLFYIDTYII